MFENMTCPLGPYDKHTTYSENALELYENIELTTATYQEDPYGGENCKCDCHNSDEANLKNNSEHCVSCGTRVCMYEYVFAAVRGTVLCNI
jgi:hypothetical protein